MSIEPLDGQPATVRFPRRFLAKERPGFQASLEVNAADALAAFHAASAKHAELAQRAEQAAAADAENEREALLAENRTARLNAQMKEAAAAAAKGGAAFDSEIFIAKLNAQHVAKAKALGARPALQAAKMDADAALAAFAYERNSAVVALEIARREPVVSTAQEQIAALFGSLALLAGISKWREDLLGDRFVFDAALSPFGGRQAAKAIISAIPPRLLPKGVDIAALDRRAAEIAKQIGAELDKSELV